MYPKQTVVTINYAKTATLKTKILESQKACERERESADQLIHQEPFNM